MKPIPVLIAVILAVLAVGLPSPVSAATETITPSVEAAPGTVSGNPLDLAVADDVRVTIAQEDVTAISVTDAWLKPDGDAGTNDWYQYGNSLCTPATLEWCYIDDDPVHDENTTFLEEAGVSQSIHDFEDLPISDDGVVDALTVWVWGKQNQSGTHAFSFGLVTARGACDEIQPNLSLAYQNFTQSTFTGCEDNPLVPSVLNAAQIILNYQACAPPCTGDPVVVTAEGITVTYSDSDFQVVGYLNFTSIPCPGGCDYELRWEGFEDGPDAALLQVDADGVWSTVATLDSSGDAGGTYVIPAEYADTGAIRFRIIDTVLDDETGGNVYLDLFAVDIDPQGGGGTGLPPVEVACTYQWASGILNCTAIVRLAESLIDGRLWLVDDRPVAQGRPGSHSIDVQVGTGLAPFRGSWNVTLRVITIMGSVLIGKTVAVADSMWLWAVYGVIIIVVIVAIANRFRPPRRRTEPPREVK